MVDVRSDTEKQFAWALEKARQVLGDGPSIDLIAQGAGVSLRIGMPNEKMAEKFKVVLYSSAREHFARGFFIPRFNLLDYSRREELLGEVLSAVKADLMQLLHRHGMASAQLAVDRALREGPKT
jgi:hypothetical protein